MCTSPTYYRITPENSYIPECFSIRFCSYKGDGPNETNPTDICPDFQRRLSRVTSKHVYPIVRMSLNTSIYKSKLLFTCCLVLQHHEDKYEILFFSGLLICMAIMYASRRQQRVLQNTILFPFIWKFLRRTFQRPKYSHVIFWEVTLLSTCVIFFVLCSAAWEDRASDRDEIHGDMVESYIRKGIREDFRGWIGLR